MRVTENHNFALIVLFTPMTPLKFKIQGESTGKIWLLEESVQGKILILIETHLKWLKSHKGHFFEEKEKT